VKSERKRKEEKGRKRKEGKGKREEMTNEMF